MNPRELVDHIRSDPAELELDEPLRFRRRTWFNRRFNPCDFSEFLQALQSSETIRYVSCGSQQTPGITEEEWGLLTFADAVNNAQSLRKLRIRAGQNFPEDSSGLTALANAFREHTALQDLTWFDCFDTVQGASRDLSLDPVLRALPACLHLRNVSISTKCASVGAMKNLLQLQSAAILTLGLTTEHWLAVADRIRQGRCNVQNLNLVLLQSSNFNDTEVVEAVASAIREDSTIESLGLLTNYDFTDEAGVALAEALTVNQTLRMLNVSTPRSRQGRNAVALSAPTCASIPVSF